MLPPTEPRIVRGVALIIAKIKIIIVMMMIIMMIIIIIIILVNSMWI